MGFPPGAPGPRQDQSQNLGPLDPGFHPGVGVQGTRGAPTAPKVGDALQPTLADFLKDITLQPSFYRQSWAFLNKVLFMELNFPRIAGTSLGVGATRILPAAVPASGASHTAPAPGMAPPGGLSSLTQLVRAGF